VSLVQLEGTALVAESGSPTNGAVDPYETVTVNWSLVNVGNAATTNLVATLKATNGVYYPSASQNYGAIPAGATVTRPFTFIPSGSCGGSVTGVVQLTDGAAEMGIISQVFPLGAVQTTIVTQVFNNTSSITIRDANTALPYPSTLSVSGVSTPVTRITARLNGVSHPYSWDINALLVGPGGQNVALMTYAGGSSVSSANLTFDDTAASDLPYDTQIVSGTYMPSDYELSVFGSIDFPSPAPSRPYGSTLAPLAAAPNGVWSLYVYDTSSGGSGNISGGWTLNFVTSNTVLSCVTTFPTPTLTSTTYSNNTVRFAWNAIPGPHYQVQYRTNLSVGSWQNLGSPILGTNTLLNVTDYVTNGPTRFYRVVVSQ
jgi:subtilisin-like proprotein convertase family protein